MFTDITVKICEPQTRDAILNPSEIVSIVPERVSMAGMEVSERSPFLSVSAARRRSEAGTCVVCVGSTGSGKVISYFVFAKVRDFLQELNDLDHDGPQAGHQ